jgi:hypothetical protein
VLDSEARKCEVADMIGTEGKDENEERVERDNPEDMLQEHQGPVQTCTTLQNYRIV